MSLLRAGGGYIPWPTMTYINKHYDTFLQRAYAILFGERNLYPDEHLLSGPKVTCSKCKLPCVSLSKAYEERHNQWIHAPTQELKRSSTGVNKIIKKRTYGNWYECVLLTNELLQVKDLSDPLEV
ncbi:unnamed protein product, partial [Rotaria magnacalcarata]